jgi:hypothetical protein
MHNCDTYHSAIGTGSNFSGLQIEFVMGDEESSVRVRSEWTFP